MSLVESIVDKLPGYVPKSRIVIEESHVFTEKNSTPKTVYQLDKAPYYKLRDVTATVSGQTVELSVGDDVESRFVNSDKYPDSIAFISSDNTPDVGSEFTVEYEAEPFIVRYVESIDDEIDIISDELDDVFLSKYIDTCPGDKLDRLGSMFGTVGRRQGRDNDEYRSFLRSIVRAFNANGTKSDIKFAVSSAVRGSPDNIRIDEDFEQTGFKVQIDPVEASILTTSLNDLIHLAKPSGVELLSPPIIEPEESRVVLKSGTMEAESSDGLGSSEIDIGEELG